MKNKGEGFPSGKQGDCMVELLKNFIKKNRFISKVFLTFNILLILGMLISGYLIIGSMSNKLYTTQLKYEKEVLSKVEKHTEGIFEQVDIIIRGFYMDSDYNSITNLMSPFKNSGVNKSGKEETINKTLRVICDANRMITDMLIIDYHTAETYYYSALKSRDKSLYYTISEVDFPSPESKKQLIQSHVPKYIIENYKTSLTPIVSIYCNLYDLDKINDTDSIGLVAVNIAASNFFDSIDMSSAENGEIFIFKDDKLVTSLYDSDLDTFNELQASTPSDYINMIRSDESGLTYVNFINREKVEALVRESQLKMIQIMFVILLISAIFSLFFSNSFAKRIQNMLIHIKNIENGEFDSALEVANNDELGVLETSFNKMGDRLADYVEKVYVSDIRRKTAEVQALQHQINPHYMFNTLESIRMVAMMNKDQEASEMISILGHMFRWNMRVKDMVISISDEFDYVKSYLELQKIRYDDSFQVHWHVDMKDVSYGTPKLILQPMIENALYHGRRDDMSIDISLDVSDDVVITIKDNGRGMDEKTLSSIVNGLTKEKNDEYSIGLSNVHQRIRLIFGLDYGLSIDSQKSVGTTVKVKIPKLSVEEMKSIVQSNDSR